MKPALLKAMPGVLLLIALSIRPSLAQPTPQDLAVLQNSKIDFVYEPPQAEELKPVMQRLQKRQLLQDLKAFLSPLRLTRKLTLMTKQCNETNAFYSSGTLIVCYEYVDHLEKLMAREGGVPVDFSRSEAVAGGLIDAMLHELGHGVFDLYDIPVFGREEDAADQVSAFVMLQFSSEMARLAIKGGGYYYLVTEREFKGSAFADSHGADRQRYYNYLCLAYGAHPDVFGDFVQRGLLPKERADHCGREYEQVRHAFVTTILPHIDQTMMKRVQSIRWIRPDDGQ
jgi:putative metallopeptidase DUF4344